MGDSLRHDEFTSNAPLALRCAFVARICKNTRSRAVHDREKFVRGTAMKNFFHESLKIVLPYRSLLIRVAAPFGA